MKSRWLGIGMVAAMWAFALAVYGRLPEEVPSHWNLQGEVDGWMARMPGAFVGPLAATFLLALVHALPWIDPRKRNLERHRDGLMLIANLLVAFFALIEGASLAQALGWSSDVSAWLQAGLGLLLVGVGNYLPRIRSNWWIGVRTPWTLDSEQVWRDTHRLAGRAFVIGGLLIVATALLPAEARGWATLVVLVPMCLLPIVYSFLAWRRESAARP